MTVFPRLLLAAILIVMAQSAFAHGTEKHGGEQQDETPVRSAGPASATPVTPDAPDPEEAGEPASQHGDDAGPVWTRLHPATVHFPIALLLVAGLVEALAMARSSPTLGSAATVLIWAGAAGAVIAALFGWIHTGPWFGGDATMQWHRWTGTGLAVAAPIAAMLSRRTDRRPFRMLLALIATAILAQGYWGGELAHGPDHLGL
ncbi:DUF2231 domain-containing protein [Pseudopontixanthobacter vadosimaris]|uniref:DUF2231 domain-containing protein n=1 Tax=Pseudopontixanthobacter vadosimaris TaxID=2726450 RepID=UPI0014757906|nr:DUF2231 domain-containing protein [Pseudopontixanthobacter vadosimaris]